MSAKEGEYKGNPTITLFQEEDTRRESRGFCFGLTKARLILAHIDQIRAFVDTKSKDKPIPEESPF